jgi:hypothetical protein
LLNEDVEMSMFDFAPFHGAPIGFGQLFDHPRNTTLALLHESPPLHLHDGTGRVIPHLTEDLVRRGYQVTSVAIGDASPARRLS